MDIQKIISDVVAKLKADPSLLKNFAADPVKTLESITGLDYDYVLVATVDARVAESIRTRLLDLGVSRNRILTVNVPEEKEELLARFLDVDAVRKEEEKRKRGNISHA